MSGIDLPAIPFPADALHDARAVFVAGRPRVGFVRVDEVDGLAHIEALAVVPRRCAAGIGSGAAGGGLRVGARAGYPAVTLTTFADVPWNAPFFAARGFVESTTLTPGAGRTARLGARRRAGRVGRADASCGANSALRCPAPAAPPAAPLTRCPTRRPPAASPAA